MVPGIGRFSPRRSEEDAVRFWGYDFSTYPHLHRRHLTFLAPVIIFFFEIEDHFKVGADGYGVYFPHWGYDSDICLDICHWCCFGTCVRSHPVGAQIPCSSSNSFHPRISVPGDFIALDDSIIVTNV